MTCKSARSTLTYPHLTQDERYQIQALRRAGLSMRARAVQLARAPSTISRELQRAGATQDNAAAAAQPLALTRQGLCRSRVVVLSRACALQFT